MKHLLLFFPILALPILAAISCKGTQGNGGNARARRENAEANRDSLLYGTWYRSYEDEGKGDGTTFVWRNSSLHTFPPSRGREGLAFLSAGKFKYIAIAPTDGMEERPGTWGWSGPKTLRMSLENGSMYILAIESLTREKLVGKWENQ